MSCSTNNSSVLPIGPKGNSGTNGQQGEKGDQGDNGLNGTTVIYSNIADASTTDGAAGAFESLQSYVLPINMLAADGDSLEIISSLSVDVDTSVAGVRLYINGASVVPVPPASFVMYPGTKFCLFKATITRQSATTVFIQFEVSLSGGTNYTITAAYQLMASGVAVNNLTTNTNTIAIFGAEAAGLNTLTAHNLLIKKLAI